MNKLGEPWAKGDTFATGSGLSVHLAWRVVDLMGGHMEISSTPGKGTTVQMEVPLPRRDIYSPSSPGKESNLDVDDDKLSLDEFVPLPIRTIALIGFDSGGLHPDLARVGESLARQYDKLGCELTTDLQAADLVVVDGRQQDDDAAFADTLARIRTNDIVILVDDAYCAPSQSAIAPEEHNGKKIRCLRKPITPALLQESLSPGSTSVGAVPQPGRLNSVSASKDEPNVLQAAEPTQDEGPWRHDHMPPRRSSFSGGEQVVRGMSDTSWVPPGSSLADAVATLSLGNLPARRRRPSSSSPPSNTQPPVLETPLPSVSVFDFGSNETGLTSPEPRAEPARRAGTAGTGVVVTVLVVEDNLINRKILVKLLAKEQVGSPSIYAGRVGAHCQGIKVVQAEEGREALEIFRGFRPPCIGTSPALTLCPIGGRV